jgi:hypothetical protein
MYLFIAAFYEMPAAKAKEKPPPASGRGLPSKPY